MRRITVREVTFIVQDSNKRYWDQADSGKWELETFDVIDRYVDSNTTVVDVGAWIGPISLYCSRLARRVIAVEPDPVAFRQLAENVALNPDIANITLLNAAVAPSAGNVRLGIRDQPGDSTSSIMLQGSGGWDVKAVTFDELLSSVPPAEKLFFKIDIEGFEFELLDQILQIATSRRAPVYLSLHPHAFEVGAAARIRSRNPVAKLLRSILKRTIGRSRALSATRTLVRKLSGSVDVYDEQGRALSLKDWPTRVLTGHNVTQTGAVLIVPKTS